MPETSRQVSISWPVWIRYACVGVLSGLLLRFGVGTARPNSLSFKNTDTRVRVVSVTPLPSSLKEIETELHLTLVAGQQEEGQAAAEEHWLQTFIQQLAPGDFAKAARRGLQLPVKLRRSFLLALTGKWAERDGGEAIGFAESQAPEELRQVLVEETLDHWAAADASGALRWIMSRTEVRQRSEYLERFIRAVEWSDPAAALIALEKLPDSTGKEAKRQDLAWRLAERDLPAAMTALLRGLKNEDGIEKATTELAALWLDKDPAAAMAWAAKLRNPGERLRFEQHLASAWARKDIQAALQWVSGQPAEKRSSLLRGVMEQWARDDPGAAKDYALALPNGEDRKAAIFNVACRLALDHNDFTGALELHKQMGFLDELRRAQFAREMLRKAGKDFSEGVEILRALPPNEENLRLLDLYIAQSVWNVQAARQVISENVLTDKLPDAARSYAECLAIRLHSPDAALAWARALPPGAARDLALCEAANGLASEHPETAVTLVLREIPASLQPEAARLVADRWFEKDPARATAWAQSLASEQSRTLACSEIVESWSRKDPTGPVVQWIESLPPGATYDVAVAKYVESVSSTDPEAGLAWIATIGDPQLRQLQAEDRARSWLQNNRQDAARWIEQTELLSPAAKQRLLSEKAQ